MYLLLLLLISITTTKKKKVILIVLAQHKFTAYLLIYNIRTHRTQEVSDRKDSYVIVKLCSFINYFEIGRRRI